MSLADPLLLDDVILHHPEVLLDLMCPGWPMLDEMIALLFAQPHVYVDGGVIDWHLPRKEFYT